MIGVASPHRCEGAEDEETVDAKKFRERVRNGEVVLGYQQFTPSPTVTEIAGLAGFDFAWLCIEHGAATLGTDLENMIRACNATDMAPLVRVTEIDQQLIQRSLELGAYGLIFPRAKTAADVRTGIEATRFFGGTRGFCPVSRAFRYGADGTWAQDADESITIIVLIETKEIYDHLDEVLSMPEVDAVFFGSADLSVSLGLDLRNDPNARTVVEGYRKRLMEACRSHGVAMGQIPQNAESAAKLIDEGITVLGTVPDTGWLFRFMNDFTRPIKEYADRSRAGSKAVLTA